MQTVTLVGITQHGKNRINQHGNRWVVINKFDSVLILESMNNTFKNGNTFEKDKRSIQIKDDKNFKIV